jgi:hypothetical protein
MWVMLSPQGEGWGEGEDTDLERGALRGFGTVEVCESVSGTEGLSPAA